MERLERDAFLIDLERGARFEADVIANTVWNVNVQVSNYCAYHEIRLDGRRARKGRQSFI